MDVKEPKDRSYNMSQIRSKNTKPEEIVRKWLFSKGFRYRKNVKELPGCPDIVLPKYKTVVFVNGCFWHLHSNCSKVIVPQTNQEFWSKKLLRNQQRDNENQRQLEKLGWKVLIVWECELNRKIREETFQTLEKNIRDL